MAESARHEVRQVSSPLASAGHWLWEELLRILPITAFFLVGFLLVLLIVKLSLAQYSIEMSTLSRAVLGALIAAKVVLLLNRTPLARALERYPAAVPVVLRTVFYGTAVVILGMAERAIDERHDHGGVAGSISYVFTHTDLHRLMAIAMGVGLVFGVYFMLTEIAAFVGEGVLTGLFFKPRRPVPVSKLRG
jgi:hypothetical protein